MTRGFEFTETDSGTKEKTKVALARTYKELDKEFADAMRNYWWKVWNDARRLCLEYGAFDTGALYESIRLLWMVEPYGGLFEVGVSSKGVELTAMIKVGGMEYINPRTGKPVNYAQAVHDGTRYMAARPFLMDAIMLNESYLQSLLEKNLNKAISGFERDY